MTHDKFLAVFNLSYQTKVKLGQFFYRKKLLSNKLFITNKMSDNCKIKYHILSPVGLSIESDHNFLPLVTCFNTTYGIT